MRKYEVHVGLFCRAALAVGVVFAAATVLMAQQPESKAQPIVLHAARLLEVRYRNRAPARRSAGRGRSHPRRRASPSIIRRAPRVIDLGDATLMPGLIDAHVHLFLHPGAEDLQTVEESVPWRTILAEQAAKADLMAGFTAERDMGTEGAGSADTAIRNAINSGPHSRAAPAHQRQRHRHPGRPRRRQPLQPRAARALQRRLRQLRRADRRSHARAAQGGLGLRQDLRDRARTA